MKIYTKTGDAGETSLFGGQRVPKDALRIEAYGTVDELNSILGVVRSQKPAAQVTRLIERIQNDLFILGSDLATPLTSANRVVPRIKPAHITPLERAIDSLEKKLTPLRAFILPGGTETASMLHFARTVCRRAERTVVTLSHNEDVGAHVIIYLNRLSDLLFVLARFANASSAEKETEWRSGRK